MKEPEYKDYMTKKKPSEEEMKSWEPIKYEHKPTRWDDFVDWMEMPHELTRGKVIFIGSIIIYIATPEFSKFLVQSGVPAFLKYYGGAILAGMALFILTRSDRS